MDNGPISQVTSSKTRLRIVELLSKRPRSLRELAGLTGISVQGVLMQLNSLKKLGLVSEKKIKSKELHIRKLYHLNGAYFHDFSAGDLTILKVGKTHVVEVRTGTVGEDLEELAGQVMVQRRQIRERVKRLARIIDELMEDEARLMNLIEKLNLSDEERIVLQTTFTEETLGEAENVLSRIQGMTNARRSIDSALAKARRSAKK